MKSKDLENKLEEIIDNSYQEEKKAVYDNLKKVFDFLDDGCGAPAQKQVARKQPAQRTASKWRNNFKNFFKKPARVAACISMAVAVACLAIILPFTLNNRNGLLPTVPPSPPMREERYCVAAACKEIKLDYSLKEYSARYNPFLLYVDWYDKAEIKTSLHVNKENSNDIIYYEEVLKHKYSHSIVELYITAKNTKVDKVEDYKKGCTNVYYLYSKYASHSDPAFSVYWGCDELVNGEYSIYKAWFYCGRDQYTVVLRYPVDENSIFDLTDSMITAKYGAVGRK